MTKNNEHKNLNVPDLRFPEFSGEWVETELQDIVPNICSGKDRISNSGEVALYVLLELLVGQILLHIKRILFS